MKLLNYMFGLMPQGAKTTVKNLLGIEGNDFGEQELGEFVLGEAIEFSRKRKGAHEAISSPQLRDALQNRQAIKSISEAYQFLQTALMEDYEQNLYSYYKKQELLILLAFLSYPFRGPGSLRSNVEPIYKAANCVSGLRILDYGAGIPYGILHLLRNTPEIIESITLVDFDLIHAEFTEFMIERLAPDVELSCIRIRNSEEVPNFGHAKFNVLYGKDIFEHVHDPELLLETMLRQADHHCVACLDINDHGEKYLQHVSPVLSPLLGIVEQNGFEIFERVGGISIFHRTNSPGTQHFLESGHQTRVPSN